MCHQLTVIGEKNYLLFYRWPYDFNVPGAKEDYITQTTPPSEVINAEVEKT